jgi:glyoxylase-like metal-dependent hydrolase (beta-lactamase superfamily II)
MKSLPALALAMALAGAGWAQRSAGELDLLHVQGNVYLLAGAGGNIALQVGSMGVLMVDTGNGASVEKALAAVSKLTDKPIRYIINTQVRADHTGGNEAVAKAGGSSGIRSIRGTPGESLVQEVKILAHDNVLQRMLAPGTGEPEVTYVAQPSDTWIGGRKDLFFNGEAIEILHQPAAITDGDSMVFFRRSDVVVAGDILDMTRYPIIDLAKGGSVQGVLDALNRLLTLTIPAHHEEGGTYVIPGHGRVVDQFDIVEYRDMVTIIRDRIQAMIKKGATLGQIKEARLTRDYDPRFGTVSGATDTFVETVYRSLTARK